MDQPTSTWSFLTNHSHVLICLALEPDMLLREVAQRVGITERAVQRILAEPEDVGALTRERLGRRNHYSVRADFPLRHPLENHCTVGDLMAVLARSGLEGAAE